MTLHAPFGISSRLLPGLRCGNGWIQLEYAGTTKEERTRYRWTIDLSDGSEHTGNDLKSGCGGGNLQQGFESLLSFLTACAESVRYRERTGQEGENEDLFPPAVGQWAAQNSDELSTLQLDIEESQEILIEE